MSNVIGVRFREVGKIHYFVHPDSNLAVWDKVIAETKRGIECGTVVLIKNNYNFDGNIQPGEKILRKVTSKDIKSLEHKKIEEKEAAEICKKKISEHKLKMKLIGTEYMFNRGKITFYFVSESRIDFRNLVKELAHVFKVRIELRQVGIRDEAKLLGGFGICGHPFCCATFLNDFHPVSIKMVKDQGISLNPTKLSGTCGRLMCCLKYEQEVYTDLLNHLPKIGAMVTTPDGIGTVIGQNAIANKVKVILNNCAESSLPVTYNANDVKVVNNVNI